MFGCKSHLCTTKYQHYLYTLLVLLLYIVNNGIQFFIFKGVCQRICYFDPLIKIKEQMTKQLTPTNTWSEKTSIAARIPLEWSKNGNTIISEEKYKKNNDNPRGRGKPLITITAFNKHQYFMARIHDHEEHFSPFKTHIIHSFNLNIIEYNKTFKQSISF